MMNYRFIRFFVMIVVLAACSTIKADDFTLKGKVIDEEGHALELVTVSCLEQGKVTMSNLKGEFSIGLKSADSVEVRFTMVLIPRRARNVPWECRVRCAVRAST